MRLKRVKIIATLGPASSSAEIITKLAEEGVDIFRINLSHQKREEILRIVQDIRSAEKKIQKPLTIMGDLAGPKIRIGNISEDVILENGKTVKISEQDVFGNSEIFSLNYPSIVKQLKKGAEVYINDGVLKLVVEKEEKNGIVEARVLVGGPLKPYKGFHAQGIFLSLPELSPKDRQDIEIMVEAKADALAVSFVQTAEDIKRVRDVLPKDSPIVLIAKIETEKAVENIEEIIDATDGIMVARGDLGLAVPIAEVPLLQKKLINLCLAKTKPVIIATQMLESMTHNPIPTRAEVTDVANAILDGTDAVMLSGETAVGEFPVHTVNTMVKIIRATVPHVAPRIYKDEDTAPTAVSSSAGVIADKLNSKLIIAFTQSGITALRIARHRHAQAIIALSPDESTLRKLNFTWGVYPKLIKTTQDFNHMMEQAREIAVENTILPLEKDEPFVIVAGMPFGESGTTNLIYVERA